MQHWGMWGPGCPLAFVSHLPARDRVSWGECKILRNAVERKDRYRDREEARESKASCMGGAGSGQHGGPFGGCQSRGRSFLLMPWCYKLYALLMCFTWTHACETIQEERSGVGCPKPSAVWLLTGELLWEMLLGDGADPDASRKVFLC